jgi:hypothetical protein
MKKFIVSLLVFSFFFAIGLLLARHKPLWTDEVCSQQTIIQPTSLPDLVLNHLQEPNKFPLYFALQKGFLVLIHYQLPFVWKGEALDADPEAQIILRILPDMYMSMALTAIVLFFGFRSGFIIGAMTALICLSMPMVWLYWAEARYYSLWFALTAGQSLLFLESVSKKKKMRPVFPFMLVHMGLCLTAPFGFIQIMTCLGLCWLAGIRQAKFYLLAGLAPLLLWTCYLGAQEKVGLNLLSPCHDIFSRNFPFEDRIFLVMYILFFFLCKEDVRRYFIWGRFFLPFCLTSVITVLAGIYYIAFKSVTHGVPVVERHFIFLSPVVIIMTAAIFSDLWSACARRLWWQTGWLIIFVSGVLSQSLSTFEIVSTNMFY